MSNLNEDNVSNENKEPVSVSKSPIPIFQEILKYLTSSGQIKPTDIKIIKQPQQKESPPNIKIQKPKF